MRLETQREIDEAVNRWKRQYTLILAEEVYKEYAASAAEADRAMNVAVDWMVISEAARAYAKEYGMMLEQEGASIIGGQKVYWLRELAENRRAAVSDIIQEGIAQGKRPGVRERVRGGYAKGTVARDLQEYFGDRRSHASTVARTETARIRNLSTLDEAKKRGRAVVKVYDGRGANPCPVCPQYDGQFWTVEYANRHEHEHPNCTRFFRPVLPEAYEGQTIVGI